MRLAKTDVIAGLDATTARELMRSLRTEKSLEYVRARLPAGTDAAAVLTELVEAGFLTEEHGSPVDGDRWWVTTTRGNGLGKASFAKPTSRGTPGPRQDVEREPGTAGQHRGDRRVRQLSGPDGRSAR